MLPSLGLPAFSSGGTMMSMPQAAPTAYPGLQGLWGPVTQPPPTGEPLARLHSSPAYARLNSLQAGQNTEAFLQRGSCSACATRILSLIVLSYYGPDTCSRGRAETRLRGSLRCAWHDQGVHCCRLFSAWVDALAPHAALLQLRSCGPPFSLPSGPPDLPWGQGRAFRGVLCAERLPLQHAQRQQLS